MSQPFRFTIIARDKSTRARVAEFSTPHGSFLTPAFLPVASQATVKTLSPRDLKEAKVSILLANAYHLSQRPGAEIIQQLGGLHKFMNWTGPLLTDSGGYQIFSLGKLSRVTDEGVAFHSKTDGSTLFFTPERVIQIQEALGPDIIMPLDQPVPYPATYEMAKKALTRTLDWAKRSLAAQTRTDQMLFGIIQGATFKDLRQQSTEELISLGCPGYAIGGLSMGEGEHLMFENLELVTSLLPPDYPRYFMGVGTPEDIIHSIALGVDLFDCVLPTRNGRNGWAFTTSGIIRLRNSIYKNDPSPLDAHCGCYTCQHFSRSYLRHLFNAGEILGMSLVSLHNIYYYETLMEQAREVIKQGDFASFDANYLAV